MKKKLFKIVIGLGVMTILMFLATALEIYSYGNNGWEPIQTDAAIVLGAAVWDDQPSPVFKERINHGINLYREGVVNRILFTGGAGKGEGRSEAEVARDYAVRQGVPLEDILIETQSTITEENLAYGKAIGQEKELSTFLIVSDPLHLKRSILIAHDQGLEAYPSPTPTTRYISLTSQGKFLLRESFFYIGYLVARPLRD